MLLRLLELQQSAVLKAVPVDLGVDPTVPKLVPMVSELDPMVPKLDLWKRSLYSFLEVLV